MALIPVIPGVIWTRYSDVLKFNSGYSALTSAGLKEWNFGTLAQRFQIRNWIDIVLKLNDCMSLAALFLGCLALVFLYKKLKRETLLIVASLTASIATILVLFNLYCVHSYYYCAVFPYMCIAAGLLIKIVYNNIPHTGVLWKYTLCISVVVLLVSVASSRYVYTFFLARDEKNVQAEEFLSVSDKVKELTDVDDYLMIFDNGWDPTIPYYSNRKALMVDKRFLDNHDINKDIQDYNTVVMSSYKETLAQKFDDFVEIPLLSLSDYTAAWNIYKLSDYNLYKSEAGSTAEASGGITNIGYLSNGEVEITGWIKADGQHCEGVVFQTKSGYVLPAMYGFDVNGERCGFVLRIDKDLWGHYNDHQFELLCSTGKDKLKLECKL